jgi:phosphomethylpyrimidine synthase
MTQLEAARKGIITPEMRRVAVRESATPEFIRDQVAAGRIIIPANRRHLAGSGGTDKPEVRSQKSEVRSQSAAGGDRASIEGTCREQPEPAGGHPGCASESMLWVNQTVGQRRRLLADPEYCRGARAPKRLDPIGVGRAISTKINANIGASPVASSTEQEVEKLRWAQLYGADALMDLSTGGELDACRQAIIDNSTIPIGTVPIYSMIVGRTIEELDHDTILRTVVRQAEQGVDFFTIHAGILREHLGLIGRRATGLVSRGGSLIARWMTHHGRQNPFYELFDEISAIMREYDVAYSLGDGVRPGCLADASDPAQIAELHVLGELVQRAREAGAQVMVEGPGHIPLNEVAWNMEKQRAVCDDAPFYVLGPVVTDVFPGYDHITSAIGATEAARAGAALLCYVTPKEHVGLPRAEDVKAGCIAYKIAAHAGDVARGIRGARQWDDDISRARAALDWPRQFELAFDGETARALHDEDIQTDADYCSMCGHDWCSLRISRELASRGAAAEAARPGGTSAARGAARRACHSDNSCNADEARRIQRALETEESPVRPE